MLQIVSPDRPYSYEAYHYGPFSRELLTDLDSLQTMGLLRVQSQPLDSEGRAKLFQYSLTDEGQETFKNLLSHSQAAQSARSVLQKYVGMSRRDLVDYVYSHYPDSVKA